MSSLRISQLFRATRSFALVSVLVFVPVRAPAAPESEALAAALAEKAEVCALPPTDHLAGGERVPLISPTARGAGYDRIVCRFFVVRRADGTGGIDEAVIPRMMEDVNVGFRQTNFRFVREPGTSYIDDDTFYADLPDFASQISLVNCCFEEGALNWFLVPVIQGGAAPAGTWIGPPFTTGMRAILMGYNFTGTPKNIVTPSHEAGHIGNLIHPYEVVFGAQCTNEFFCNMRGDLLCDTPASPGLSSLNVTATGFFYSGQVGPCAGDPPFNPNPTLYMDTSSSPGHIRRNSFSPQQMDKMVTVNFSQQADLFGPLRPDIFVDCDNNGQDDLDEILAGTTADLNEDMVPDVCQTFPSPGDLMVCGMTSHLKNRPRYYDGVTGDYRGDMWNGMPFVHQLRLGPDGLVYFPSLTVIQRMDPATGRTVDNVADGRLEAIGVFVDLLFDANGDILALDNNFSDIRRYDVDTGAFLGTFSTLGSVTLPKYMEYGPDGHIYVAAVGALGNSIRRFDGTTGVGMGAFVAPNSGGLSAGQGLTFHGPHLYVSNVPANNVLQFDALTGAFVSEFVSPGDGGLNNPHSLRFGPDGSLYVASRNTHSVKRYDGNTGAYIDDFVAANSGGSPGLGGLQSPAGLLFLPGGAVTSAPEIRLPATFSLSNPRPNPTRGTTVLHYQLDRTANVSAAAFNVAGQRVRDLEQGTKQAGEHVLAWDGRDAAGQPVGSGVYFMRVSVDGVSEGRRVQIQR